MIENSIGRGRRKHTSTWNVLFEELPFIGNKCPDICGGNLL